MGDLKKKAFSQYCTSHCLLSEMPKSGGSQCSRDSSLPLRHLLCNTAVCWVGLFKLCGVMQIIWIWRLAAPASTPIVHFAANWNLAIHFCIQPSLIFYLHLLLRGREVLPKDGSSHSKTVPKINRMSHPLDKPPVLHWLSLIFSWI